MDIVPREWVFDPPSLSSSSPLQHNEPCNGSTSSASSSRCHHQQHQRRWYSRPSNAAATTIGITVVGGIVGGAVAGPIGAAIGAKTASSLSVCVGTGAVLGMASSYGGTRRRNRNQHRHGYGSGRPTDDGTIHDGGMNRSDGADGVLEHSNNEKKDK
eukprot:gb/GECH01011496.1/.p1 GENE.gb/GECH01011496.1/~~gb/GECH01011496.1/.p1  ORF type:complete len:157 (+),score=42.90 gb/GECH01011496.1/:1-471(+)